MKNRNKKRAKINNAGSTLITVLVGVGFLLILAVITITISTANLHMKQIEYRMKDNFYADEQVLDDVYNGIGKVTADCLSKAYADVLSQVSDAGGKAVFKTQDAAYRSFSLQFINGLKTILPVCSKDDGDLTNYNGLLAKLNSYITQKIALDGTGAYNTEVIEFSRTEILDEDDNVWTDGIGAKLPAKYIFRDVVVKYRQANGNESAGYTANGYEATITTDIVIEIPYISFFQDSSRILDYALIGNKGIYFDSCSSRQIEGNVYAGINDSETEENKKKYRDEDVYGGINIYNSGVSFNSNYLISKGDINVRNSNLTVGNLESAADTQLWAESLRTVENINRNAAEEASAVVINGNSYIANDLELNARKSSVTLKGTYYGYNNGVFSNQESKNLLKRNENNPVEHTQSSALIINGNGSTLDLGGLDTLVVSGVAYIDLQSQAYTGENIRNNGGTSAGIIEEYATGESLALKSNQYMYLVPTSCLLTTNPVKTSEKPEMVWNAETQWFGVTKGYVSASDPYLEKEVINRTTGESYTYFYLKFLDGKSTEYANLILNMKHPENGLTDMDAAIKAKLGYDGFTDEELIQIWNVKKSLQNKALSENVKPTITLADSTTANIYTRGAVTKITDDSLTSELSKEENSLSGEYIRKVESNLVKHYKYLYAELDPKTDFSMTSDSLPTLADDSIAADAPVSKYVDFTGMVNSLTPDPYKCGYYTYLYKGNHSVDRNVRGIILCDGDLTIKGGVNVEGLVIASGKIIIEGNGEIIANRSIVQAILDEERTEEEKKKSETERNMKYASSYLLDFKLKSEDYTGKDYTDRTSSTEYTDYISYQNWRKGGE